MSQILIAIIKLYKLVLSPLAEKLFGGACRFTPTCSEYTIGALERYGAARGVALGIKRFFRCHPWGGSGYDPVPDLK